MIVLMKKQNVNLPATKQDLEKLATKKDLKKLAKATKKDLKKLSKEITGVDKRLTKEANRLDTKIDSVEKTLCVEIRLSAEETKKEIKEEIKQSESRVVNVLDTYLGELETSREERAIAAHQVLQDRKRIEDNEHRITVLEQQVVSSA